MSVNDCQLEGKIPSELGNLWNMTRLQLHSNFFDGTIPTTFGKLSNLDFLTIEGNLLSGQVPNSLCDLRIPEGVDPEDAVPGQALRHLIVDCYDPRSGLGFDCDIPKCCTLCRNVQN